MSAGGRVVVVGLGPAGPDLVTGAALDAIASVPAEARFVRTVRHPAAVAVGGAASFDDVYDEARTLDEVYGEIVERLGRAASARGVVVYAVPGSPAVAERTVELLRERSDLTVDVVPALSFLDVSWVRLGIDPVAVGVRVIDGHRFAVEAAGERGPLLVAQCDRRDVLSEIKLAVEDPTDDNVTVLQRLGLPDERVFEVAWNDLDRAIEPDHLTSLYIPVLAAPVGYELVRFAELVRTLREQCPWDRAQTHQSLTRYLLEESYEVIEAIEALEPDGSGMEHLEEELGDLLFQTFFHSAIATQAGEFTLADVARGIHDKLVRRHPHVFVEDGADASDHGAQWEAIKRAEKGRASTMDGVNLAMPALLLAHKVQKKAAAVGFDWPSVDGAYAKVAEELEELRDDPSAEELGDLLFAAVNVARHLGIDPEAALRAASTKFRSRFDEVERLAGERMIDMASADIAALDSLWDEVKST